MHKIITSTLTLGAALFLLAGCSSSSSSSKTASSSSTTAKKSSSAQTSSSTSSQSSQAETSSASSSQVAATSSTPWNSAKAQQLRSFMNAWGPSMHQSYAELSPGDYQWFGGVNNTIGSYEGDGSTFEWSTTGTGNYDYNVVAMYNYNKSPQGDGNASTNIGEYHITYAFAYHNGQPVALVSQSTNGGMVWTPTKNATVQSNWARIAGSATN
ncbi:DUF4767 domain-containing protein [Limosilactobacillus fermentum]|uniref:DUF4767 domain-containing protein n=1 Tax=Limosilactobacillus fermentum TaxID=1613 RepID=UPI0021821AD2|nr:DUF4767 domain-containing protein [Limosilactobacillus fermentum]MCS8619434.1 DUF4767 domain-containing protein [Limosilactobacillus fermentum]